MPGQSGDLFDRHTLVAHHADERGPQFLRHPADTISPGAPVQAALRAKLDAVLAEQDDRARMAAGA